MDRQIINFSANEQSLIKTGGLDHYAGNVVRYIEAHFNLGANWSGYDSVRAIWRNKRDVTRYSTVLNSEGVCIVPFEVLTMRGDVCMNLVGSIVEDDVLVDRLTTYPICALTVDVPAMVDGSDPASITPSEYEQFVASVRNDADRAETGATASEASASEASASAEQATASAQVSEASALRSASSAQNAQNSERNASEYAQDAHISAQNAETWALDAEEAKRKILSMRAEAETLAEGSQATASYSDGVLTLGIPKGDTGARGEKGETGETGATPNLSIGTVETLEPTEPATASITGTAENPVLNLGLPQGRTGEVTYDDLKTLLPQETASGSIVSITDGQSVIPVDSLKVSLEAIQSGSGTPSPDNVRPISGHTEVNTHRTGKNLIETDEFVLPNNSNSNTVWSGSMTGSFVLSIEKSGVSSVVNPSQMVAYAIVDGARKPLIYSTGCVAFSGNLTEILVYGSLAYAKVVGTIGLQLEVGSTATDYEPYQGNTYTTTLGRTVYGGTLDVVSGELVVDRAMVTPTSVNGITQHSLGTWYCTIRLNDTASASDDALISNMFVRGYLTDGVGACYTTSSGVLLVAVLPQDVTTKADADAWFEANQPTFVYRLATPQTIQLTPQQVMLLTGDNNLWSDGDITMVYSADVQRWVEKKLNS